MRPMFEVDGVVRAPLSEVTDLVLTVHAQAVQPDGYQVHVDVDRDRRTLGVQGNWWYRGEYRLEPDPAGTRIVYSVFNVAKRGRALVPLANKLFIGYRESMRRALAEMIRDLERKLA
ncbi:hypothetical protein EV193_104138 [Herbihabitans rhizosphaerae]|uniref:Polyketide cyclase/dehydrase/lipid transport protein n=1 Tax=Herbihabitans rhizosphaerae TaxID=1872711 RepID=A0A4Q7KR54_9PSEU|nr:hypothetical protein [Herbihabitans rhizosphaerae]RZS38927.1 hypothetical protein EV193_104138 [Herbihabitans rhizosphaerae]